MIILSGASQTSCQGKEYNFNTALIITRISNNSYLLGWINSACEIRLFFQEIVKLGYGDWCRALVVIVHIQINIHS